MNRTLTVPAKHTQNGVLLQAPAVGIWHHRCHNGQILQPGDALGYLNVLGHQYPIFVPPDITGRIIDYKGASPAQTMVAVSYGASLVSLDTTTLASHQQTKQAAIYSASISDAVGLVLPCPMSGRYYGRPQPTEPPFVTVGSVIEAGRIIALIEVMKTFNRVVYPGPTQGLPSPAKVVKIFPKEDGDVARGEPLIELEPTTPE
ncbi:MAG: hypothetical protein KTR25_06640 [Myxococcales bacterium]|nr:hypothetical protein [Myxococcales bacterium]